MEATLNKSDLEASFIKSLRECDGKACLAAIKQGVTPNTAGEDGFTVLHMLAGFGKEPLIHELLTMNANVNARTTDGRTPLHLAADGDHAHICVLLIKAGADVHAKDDEGNTPLARRPFGRSLRTMAALIAYGAQVPDKDLFKLSSIGGSVGALRKLRKTGELTERRAAVVAELPDRLIELICDGAPASEQDRPESLIAFAAEQGLPNMQATIQAHIAKAAIQAVLDTAAAKGSPASPD